MITCKAINTGGLGRFGNTCFSLASTIGIAMRNGQPFGFDPWRTVDNALFGQPIDYIEDYLVNPLPRIPEALSFADIPYHWEYRDYKVPTGNWNICSHLQDPRYFDDYMPLIRDVFRFKDEPQQNYYVAVHVRCGDYIKDSAAYHPVQSADYYKQAMDLFPEGTHFELFSDEPDYAFDMLKGFTKGKSLQNQGPNTHYLDDFKLMKQCKHFITANSSFSLMAAILGEHPEKKIVCPRLWFGKQADIKFEGYPQNAYII